MVKLDRERTIAVGALLLVLLAAIAVPIWALQQRADAAQDLTDAQELLDKLEAAHQRAAGKTAAQTHRPTKAPQEAFVSASTSGLASAQLESHLSQLISKARATLVSSSVKPADRADGPDTLRIQVNLEIPYDSLQSFLYQLETGTPYVFVDSMSLLPERAQAAPAAPMKATLNLRAFWRRPST
jgi:general secretion pathway protein M